MTNLLGPLHIPAKRPGFDADPSILRSHHPWSTYESAAGYDQYSSHYILDRDRKPLYPYPTYTDPNFPQVRTFHFFFLFFIRKMFKSSFSKCFNNK